MAKCSAFGKIDQTRTAFGQMSRLNKRAVLSMTLNSGGSNGGEQGEGGGTPPVRLLAPVAPPPSDNSIIRLASAIKIVELLYVSIGIEFAQALTTVRNWSMVRVE